MSAMSDIDILLTKLMDRLANMTPDEAAMYQVALGSKEVQCLISYSHLH